MSKKGTAEERGILRRTEQNRRKEKFRESSFAKKCCKEHHWKEAYPCGDFWR